MAGGIGTLGATLRWRAAALASRLLEHVERCEQTVICVHGGAAAPQQSGRLCLFAAYDPAGRLAPYAAHHLRALAANGFDIVLVYTGPRMRGEDLESARRLCRLVVQRRNVGLDFASWRAGLALADTTPYRRILLANDSVIGPCRDLAPVFAAFESSGAGLCGITDSAEGARHLQSYFLYANLDRLPVAAWHAFWEGVRPVRNKAELIRRYERGLSSAMRAAGASLFALAPCDAVHAAAHALGDRFQYADRLARGPLNPSLFMWDLLLTRFGAPYVKTELFRQDRFRSRALARWRELVPEESRGAIVPLVEAYLADLAGKAQEAAHA